MVIILDLILVAIIIVSVIISAKRGFVKVFVETVGFVAAVILAFTISTPLAELTYDKIIEPPVVKAAVNAAEDNAQADIKSALPEFLVDNKLFADTVDTFAEKFNEHISDGAEIAVKTASRDVVRPITVKIIGLFYSIILLVILMIIVKFLAKLLNSLFSFSIVGTLNHILGGFVGVFKGIIISMIFCMIISLLIYFTGKGIWIFSIENISNSFIFKFFTEFISIK